MARTTPSYVGLKPASSRATAAARGSSRKSDTRCETLLRSELWKAGYRFRKNVSDLPGKPDIVFARAKVVVFCDGDFWHGKNWKARQRKLRQGTNAAYWIEKIKRNRLRDRRNTNLLRKEGWIVLRFWESDILADPIEVITRIVETLERVENPSSISPIFKRKIRHR